MLCCGFAARMELLSIDALLGPLTGHATLADPTEADAILDRLVHSSYSLKWESMRKEIPGHVPSCGTTGRFQAEWVDDLDQNR
jgi:hypothetical protein